MSKPYDPTAPNPSKMVDLIRRLGRRDSAPMPVAEPVPELDEMRDDPGSGPIVTPERRP